MIDKNAFYEMAENATNNMFEFAKFSAFAENWCDDEALKSSYNTAWFEIETINALALSDWEDEGKPSSWQSQWNIKYKNEAEVVVNTLLAVVRSI